METHSPALENPRWHVAFGTDDDAEPFLLLSPLNDSALLLGMLLGKVPWEGSVVLSETQIAVLDTQGSALTKAPAPPGLATALGDVGWVRVFIPSGPARRITEADVEELLEGEKVAETRLPLVVLPV